MSKRAKAWGVGLISVVLLQVAVSLVAPHSFALVAFSDIQQLLLLFAADI